MDCGVNFFMKLMVGGVLLLSLIASPDLRANECASFLQEKFGFNLDLKGRQKASLRHVIHAQSGAPIVTVLIGPELLRQFKRYTVNHIIAPNFASFLAGERKHAGIVLADQELIIKRKQGVLNDRFVISFPHGVLYFKLAKPWPKFSAAEKQVLRSLFGHHYMAYAQQQHARFNIGRDLSFIVIMIAGLGVANAQMELNLDHTTLMAVLSVAGLGSLRGVFPWFQARRNTHYALMNILEELAQGNLAKLIEEVVVVVSQERVARQLEYDFSLVRLKMLPEQDHEEKKGPAEENNQQDLLELQDPQKSPGTLQEEEQD